MNTITEVKGNRWFGIVNQFINSPVETLIKLGQAHPDIVSFKTLGKTGYLVNSPELVREVLVTKGKSFRKVDAEMELMGSFMGNGLVTNNNPAHHKRQRKLVQPAFHHRRIAAYAEVMVDYTVQMLDGWEVDEVRDLSHEMRDLTMYIVAKTLFDADRNDISSDAGKLGHAMETFQAYTDENFGLPFRIPLWVPTRRNRRFNADKQFVDQTLRNIIDARRASGEDKGDLLSMLLMGQDEDGSGMDDRQLLDEVITLFAAGHETTSNALTWTWYQLSQHPDVQARMYAEIETALQGRTPTLHDLKALPYTLMVLKESMRLLPSVYALNGRFSNEDVQIGNYLIPKDRWVLVSPVALHRNPRLWDEPERFDPERFNAENEPNIPRYAYLPFGAGARVCIGNSFAMMEAQLILATMAQRFTFELLPTQKIELLPQITLSSKHGMHMRLLPHGVAVQNSAEPIPA